MRLIISAILIIDTTSGTENINVLILLRVIPKLFFIFYPLNPVVYLKLVWVAYPFSKWMV